MSGGISIGTGLGLDRLTCGGYAFVNSEAAALVARFVTPATDARKALIDTFIGALKTAGVWSKLDVLHIMAAHDAQAARQNWIADQYNLTPVASPTFTVDRGYQSDGSSSYLTTGFNPSTAPGPKFTQNNGAFGLWSRMNVQSGTGSEMGNSNNVILPRNTSDQALYRVNNSGTASGTTNGGSMDSSGFFAALRSTSTAERLRRNATQLNANPASPSSMSNSPFTVCARNGNTSGGYTVSAYGVRQLSAHFIGANLSDLESDSFNVAMNTYLTAIGAV